MCEWCRWGGSIFTPLAFRQSHADAVLVSLLSPGAALVLAPTAEPQNCMQALDGMDNVEDAMELQADEVETDDVLANLYNFMPGAQAQRDRRMHTND